MCRWCVGVCVGSYTRHVVRRSSSDHNPLRTHATAPTTSQLPDDIAYWWWYLGRQTPCAHGRHGMSRDSKTSESCGREGREGRRLRRRVGAGMREGGGDKKVYLMRLFLPQPRSGVIGSGHIPSVSLICPPHIPVIPIIKNGIHHEKWDASRWW